jgi:hypothetical protein
MAPIVEAVRWADRVQCKSSRESAQCISAWQRASQELHPKVESARSVTLRYFTLLTNGFGSPTKDTKLARSIRRCVEYAKPRATKSGDHEEKQRTLAVVANWARLEDLRNAFTRVLA